MTDMELANQVRLAVRNYNMAVDEARHGGLKVRGTLELDLYPALRTECLRQIDPEQDGVICPEPGCDRRLSE